MYKMCNNFQMEYTQRVQKELRRKHALQNKQQPKNLRRKKQQIHKQFEATCKIIESQVSKLSFYQAILSDHVILSGHEISSYHVILSNPLNKHRGSQN